jgi:hypothetical protein
MPKEADPKRKSTAALGCLTFIVGAVLGYVIAFLWSNSQVHMLGSQELRGELRTRTVFAHAFLGAIVGGLLVSGIAVIRRKLNDWCRSSTDQQKLPK